MPGLLFGILYVATQFEYLININVWLSGGLVNELLFCPEPDNVQSLKTQYCLWHEKLRWP